MAEEEGRGGDSEGSRCPVSGRWLDTSVSALHGEDEGDGEGGEEALAAAGDGDFPLSSFLLSLYEEGLPLGEEAEEAGEEAEEEEEREDGAGGDSSGRGVTRGQEVKEAHPRWRAQRARGGEARR